MKRRTENDADSAVRHSVEATLPRLPFVRDTRQGRLRPVWLNILLAIAISLIINFSYFVFIILSATQNSGRPMPTAPRSDLVIILEVVYCFLLAFILLSVFTMHTGGGSSREAYPRRLVVCTIIVAAGYFIAPHMERYGGITPVFMARRLFQPILLLKCSFILVVTGLYGMIYDLLYERQHIRIENEKLRNETLQSKYDVLIGQINPHFFFNSLNSLAMLVREGRRDAALTYIDRLSDTFRYVLQSERSAMTTLGEELEFLDAYKYLFEVRYDGKLFFDVDIPPRYRTWSLPALSLQPLLENAVKHNSITYDKPLRINITACNGRLVISNPLQPRENESKNSTGIGLYNLSSRFKLLCGKDMAVSNKGGSFVVSLPLKKPES